MCSGWLTAQLEDPLLFTDSRNSSRGTELSFCSMSSDQTRSSRALCNRTRVRAAVPFIHVYFPVIIELLFLCVPQVGRAVSGWVSRAFRSTSSSAAAQLPLTVDEPVTDHAPEECPVCAYNEWDPLEEVIVGRAENACVPPFTVEVKVRISPVSVPRSRHWYSSCGGILRFSGSPNMTEN